MDLVQLFQRYLHIVVYAKTEVGLELVYLFYFIFFEIVKFQFTGCGMNAEVALCFTVYI